MRTRIGVLAAAVLLSLVPSFVGADTLSQSWYTYEQGNAAFSRKEYGEALKFYKDAIGAAGIFPEAEMGLGDVYLAEGEFDLAKGEYEKAYSQKSAFYVPERKYELLYKMAHLFQEQELYKRMEDRLGEIVADDRHFAESATSKMRTQVERNYLTKGLDRVLELYTFSDPFALEAHSTLGWFYYRTGRYSQAVSHLLYATITRVSQVNQDLRDSDVDYQFSTLQAALAAVAADKELAAFVAGSDFFKDLYYLAGSAFANGYPEHAVTLWKLIAGQAAAGAWQVKARAQLKKPVTEPLIGSDVNGQRGKNGD
jgi:tetratricopeptide (TPR) repeat protein